MLCNTKKYTLKKPTTPSHFSQTQTAPRVHCNPKGGVSLSDLRKPELLRVDDIKTLCGVSPYYLFLSKITYLECQLSKYSLSIFQQQICTTGNVFPIKVTPKSLLYFSP